MSDAVRAVTVGRAIPLPGNDIDTDRIIPARYLKSITSAASSGGRRSDATDGLGEAAFIDARAADRAAGRTHPLDDARYTGGSILLVGRNFGCGSSREHAPQALQRFGIRALVGESFAEIFAGNCTVLGLPAVRAAAADLERLLELVGQHPETEVTVDLEAQTVTAGALQCPATLPDGARHALVRGTWDSTTLLLANRDRIAATTARLPYLNAFAER